MRVPSCDADAAGAGDAAADVVGSDDGEIDDPINDDWPPVGNISAGAWQAALKALEDSHAALRARVLDLTDAQLDDPVTGSDPTVRGMLLGVLQHSGYHAGQIALLRRGTGGTP